MKEDLSFKRIKVIMVEDEEEIKKIKQIITKILKWGGHPSPKALVHQNLFQATTCLHLGRGSILAVRNPGTDTNVLLWDREETV